MDHKKIGRHLARMLLTREQRERLCWFPSKKAHAGSERERVPKALEKLFAGNSFKIVRFFQSYNISKKHNGTQRWYFASSLSHEVFKCLVNYLLCDLDALKMVQTTLVCMRGA